MTSPLPLSFTLTLDPILARMPPFHCEIEKKISHLQQTEITQAINRLAAIATAIRTRELCSFMNPIWP